MTYAGFLACFVVPVILLGVWRHHDALRRRRWVALVLLLPVVYIAATPWDQAAMARGLWGFDETRIWGARLGRVPLEEYLFFGLQTLAVGVWVLGRTAPR